VEAAKAGVADDTISAIADKRQPVLAAAEQAVYGVAGELVADGALAEATFVEADRRLGRQALVELVGLVGYYTLVAMTLNAFEVPVPQGAPRLP
jgi:4-carboxymuconolactone decarboxylase